MGVFEQQPADKHREGYHMFFSGTMNPKSLRKRNRQEGGYVMVASMALMMVLLATGIAFMRWATDESLQSQRAVAAQKAYYLAQMGVVERGFAWLRSLQASDLPIGEIYLGERSIPDFGTYEDVRVTRIVSTASNDNFFVTNKSYRITAVGVVPIQAYDESGVGGEHAYEVKRKAVLYVSVRSFADYMYLSHYEETNFGDKIKFWHEDTLRGRVHSNTQIAIMERPFFYEQVSTTADDFWRGSGYNPYFAMPPLFNAPEVTIPDVAENLRACAATSGNYYVFPNQTVQIRCHGASATAWRWETGTPLDTNEAISWTISFAGPTCVFVDGPMELYGIVRGKVTFGASHTVRLLDNIRYMDANPNTGETSENSTDLMGIVSEGDVKVANTWANGRENSNHMGFNQGNKAFTDIVITAAVVALGESFTFEQQNDPDSGYVYDGGLDDRGYIFIYGSLTQKRRGYVHRSNNGSTGYGKRYMYDERFLFERPPGFFDATTEGRALFNIVQWGQVKEEDDDVNNGIVVRYN